METPINEVIAYVLGVIFIIGMPIALIVGWIIYLVRLNSENPMQLKGILIGTVLGIIAIVITCCSLPGLIGEK